MRFKHLVWIAVRAIYSSVSIWNKILENANHKKMRADQMDIEWLQYPGYFCRRLTGAKTRISFFPQESLEVDKAEFGQIDIFNLYKWFLDVFLAARPTHAQRSQDIS